MNVVSCRKNLVDKITLTNKWCFLEEQKCPCCGEKTIKESSKVLYLWGKGYQYVLANVRYCKQCSLNYVTPQQFLKICDKAKVKLFDFDRGLFLVSTKIGFSIEKIDGKDCFIPDWAFGDKYDRYNLPPQGNQFYDMTDEEYLWIKDMYKTEDFSDRFRSKSFLGEAGYSTSESEVRRHKILATCVEKYGKGKVLAQLKSNMNMRIKQKDGSERFAHALNVWRGDISYVEKSF